MTSAVPAHTPASSAALRPPEPALSTEMRDQVLTRLGIPRGGPPDLAMLRDVYRAWCDQIPFDNVRKLIALRTGDAGPLPGTLGTDFFEHFLEHGTGGTCWPTSNAIYELLVAMGFAARRVAGSMRDQGFVTHGTVKVAIDGTDWLADTSILSNSLLPVGNGVFISDDRLFTAEVEPTDDAHMVWFSNAPNESYTPCRLMIDPIDHEYLHRAYEKSRGFGVFNQHIYARRNFPGLMLVMRGPLLHRRTIEGTETQALTQTQMLTSLHDVFGISETMLARWVDAGALAASFEPWKGPAPTMPVRLAPSQRTATG